MKLFLYSFLALILTCSIICQKNSGRKQCNFNTDADTCLMNLLLLGDPKFVFPENDAGMTKFCKSITGYEKCIKDYSGQCLDTFPKQVTRVLAYGIAKTNKGYCSNRKRKDSFIAIGKCANIVKSAGDKCMHKFIDDLQGSENYADVKLRIPLGCCNFYKMKACIMDRVEKAGRDICSERDYTEIERIIDGYSDEVLNLICGDYIENSDKCDKLLPKTPKKLSSQKRPKSMLYPFINILAGGPAI